MFVLLEPLMTQDLLHAFISESLTPVLLQQLGDKAPESVAMILAPLVRYLQFLINNCFINLQLIRRLKWLEAEHQLVCDQADCPPVRSEGVRLSFYHFGRLILRLPYRCCGEEIFS